MPHETEFVDYITDRDRIRVIFTLDRGVPEQIVVQLECEIQGRWRAARRYDNRHGYVHLHVKPWDEANDRTTRMAVGDLRHAIVVLIDDLMLNWQTVRARLEDDLRMGHYDA